MEREEKEVSIKVVKAKKSFKNHTVLDMVDLECKKGEICGIVGRNGAGKTVLFKAICGLLTLDSGEIYINGIKRKKDNEMLKSVGVIIEEPAFLRNYSGIKNLEFLYMLCNKPDKRYLQSVMERVGLDPYSRKHVDNYSMGMRQRLAIAQAIMENQDFLILDEPMNGLDNEGVEDMRKLFLELKDQGKTILVASHNPMDIEVLCERVYSMDKGILTLSKQ